MLNDVKTSIVLLNEASEGTLQTHGLRRVSCESAVHSRKAGGVQAAGRVLLSGGLAVCGA